MSASEKKSKKDIRENAKVGVKKSGAENLKFSPKYLFIKDFNVN